MSRTIHKTDKPVTLEGFQAVVAPSKFGYSLGAIVGPDIIETLESERTEVLKWCESSCSCRDQRSFCLYYKI